MKVATGAWTMEWTCPPDWADTLAACGGGFFHAPPGLLVGAPRGEPVFCVRREGGETVGLTLGVRSSCRLSAKPLHYYFPTLPAFVDPAAAEEATADLVRDLAGAGAATVEFDSFDARWVPESLARGVVAGKARQEHLLEWSQGSKPEAAFGKTHRRHLRRGVKGGWTLRAVSGSEAVEVLERAQVSTGNRASSLGRGFAPNVPREAAQRPLASLTEPWGTVTFGAWSGDTLLAAALIGFGNGRGLYIAGGSTPDGFQVSASVWLQWQIICSLLECGFTAYNLGGTPATAASPDDPAHGLYRFKVGFGAAAVPRVGARWVCNGWHEGLHRVMRRFGGGRR